MHIMPVKRRLAVAAAIALGITGCAKHAAPVQPATGQVAARLGGQVVTVAELQNELRLAKVPEDKRSDPAAVKAALGEIVLRKYLLQQALDAKLDREPGTLLDLMRAHDQVLANAYLARKMAARSVSKAEIANYIADNPAKFAERQVLQLEQIAIAMRSYSQAVIDATHGATSLNAVDQKLTSLGVLHERTIRSVSEADLPPDLARTLLLKHADDIVFLRAGARGFFVDVKSKQQEPLEGEAAEKLAIQMLAAENIKSQIAIESGAALRAVKYEDGYASIMGAAPAQGATEATSGLEAGAADATSGSEPARPPEAAGASEAK